VTMCDDLLICRNGKTTEVDSCLRTMESLTQKHGARDSTCEAS